MLLGAGKKKTGSVPRWAKRTLPLCMFAIGVVVFVALALNVLRIAIMKPDARYYFTTSAGAPLFLCVFFGLLGVIVWLLRRTHPHPETPIVMMVGLGNIALFFFILTGVVMATEYVLVSPHGFEYHSPLQNIRMEFADIESFELGDTSSTQTYRVSAAGRQLVSEESETPFYCYSKGECISLPGALRGRAWGDIRRIAIDRGIDVSGVD